MSKTTSVDETCNVSDEALMAEYAAGKVEAFDELFGRYEHAAYALIKQLFFCKTG